MVRFNQRSFSYFSDEHPGWYEVYTTNGLYHIYLEEMDDVWVIDEFEGKENSYSNRLESGEPLFEVEEG